jgi:hypothetical protein
MLYKLGRLLQFVGLLLLPVAVSGGVLGRLDEKQELLIAGSGVAVFLLGWLVQEAGKRG